jgi:hypothetical protein
MKQYQINPFLRIKKKTYEIFAYFVQILILIVFLTDFNTLVLLFLVCMKTQLYLVRKRRPRYI